MKLHLPNMLLAAVSAAVLSTAALAEDVTYEGICNTTSRYGGALTVSSKTSQTWDGAENVTLTGNSVISHDGVYGGAISISGGSVVIDNAENVDFSDNYVESTAAKAAHGGAVYLYGSNSLFEIKNSGSVTFEGNYVTTEGYEADYAATGGAIKSINGNLVNITNNQDVCFSGNYAEDLHRGRVYGGAIDTYGLSISGNANVTFTGNHINATTDLSYFDKVGFFTQLGKDDETNISLGGAIHAKSGGSTAGYVEIRDNDSLLIRGNYIHTVDTREGRETDEYVLNGIHAEANRSSSTIKSYTHVNLSTAGTAIICDSTVVEGSLNINESYNGKPQNGTVIFTGAYTEQDLNAIIAANTAEGETARTATEAEITASRTHSVLQGVTVHAGTLSLQDGVILKAEEGITVKSGATLEVVSATAPELCAFSLAEAALTMPTAAVVDADLFLEDTASLTLVGGALDMNGNDVVMGEGVILTLVLDSLENVEGANLFLFVNEADGAVTLSDSTVLMLTDGTTTLSATFSDNQDGSITIEETKSIPEPTTATLSLLALAALAARRRRC